jgi:hypothetical protein
MLGALIVAGVARVVASARPSRADEWTSRASGAPVCPWPLARPRCRRVSRVCRSCRLVVSEFAGRRRQGNCVFSAPGTARTESRAPCSSMRRDSAARRDSSAHMSPRVSTGRAGVEEKRTRSRRVLLRWPGHVASVPHPWALRRLAPNSTRDVADAADNVACARSCPRPDARRHRPMLSRGMAGDRTTEPEFCDAREVLRGGLGIGATIARSSIRVAARIRGGPRSRRHSRGWMRGRRLPGTGSAHLHAPPIVAIGAVRRRARPVGQLGAA